MEVIWEIRKCCSLKFRGRVRIFWSFARQRFHWSNSHNMQHQQKTICVTQQQVVLRIIYLQDPSSSQMSHWATQFRILSMSFLLPGSSMSQPAVAHSLVDQRKQHKVKQDHCQEICWGICLCLTSVQRLQSDCLDNRQEDKAFPSVHIVAEHIYQGYNCSVGIHASWGFIKRM